MTREIPRELNPTAAMEKVKNNQIYAAESPTLCPTKAQECVVTPLSLEVREMWRDTWLKSNYKPVDILYFAQVLPCPQGFIF